MVWLDKLLKRHAEPAETTAVETLAVPEPDPPPPTPEPTTVQCATCGFLEAGDVLGGIGRPATIRERYHGDLGLHFRCFRQAWPIHDEFRAALAKPEASGVPYERTALAVVHRERSCERWFEFEPGSSLKDHLDWQHMLQIERDRRAHDLELARLQTDSQKSMESIMETSQTIQNEIKTLTNEAQTFTTKWTHRAFFVAIAALVCAAVAAVFVVLAYFKP